MIERARDSCGGAMSIKLGSEPGGNKLQNRITQLHTVQKTNSIFFQNQTQLNQSEPSLPQKQIHSLLMINNMH